MSDFELVYWHIINMKMLEDGLWSKFKFQKKIDHELFSELLLITALKAKKLSNSIEEY